MQPRQISVALFDDHPAMRMALAAALTAEGSFNVVATGSSADEAAACANAALPDVIIVDLHMPGGGLEAVQRLYCESPAVKPVVLSSDDSEHVVRAAFLSGAFGYLVKGQPLLALAAALKAIAGGQAQFPAGLAASLVASRGFATPWNIAGMQGPLQLTAREEQILSRFAQGLRIEEIAPSIGVSGPAAAAYLTNILHKLHEQTLFERVLGVGGGA